MSDDPIQPDSAPFGDDPLSDSPFASPEDQLQDEDSWLLEGAEGETEERATVHAEVQALPDEFIVEGSGGDDLGGAAPISEDDLVGASYVEPEPGSRVLSRALVPATVALVLSFGGVAVWKFMESGGVALRPEVAETPGTDSVVRVPERNDEVGLPPVIEPVDPSGGTGRMSYRHDGSVVPVAVDEPAPEATVETPREPGELSAAPMESMAAADVGEPIAPEPEPAPVVPEPQDEEFVAEAFEPIPEMDLDPSTWESEFAATDAPVDTEVPDSPEPKTPLTITAHPFFSTLASVGLPVDPFADRPVDIHGRANFTPEPCVPFGEFDVPVAMTDGAAEAVPDTVAAAPVLDRARIVDELAAAPVASEEELEAMAFVPFTFGADEVTSEVAVQSEPAPTPEPVEEVASVDEATEEPNQDTAEELTAEPTEEVIVAPEATDVAEAPATVPAEDVTVVTPEIEPTPETPAALVPQTEEPQKPEVIAAAPAPGEGSDIDVEAVHARLDAIFGMDDEVVFEPIEVMEVEPVPVQAPEEVAVAPAPEVSEDTPEMSDVFPLPAPVVVDAKPEVEPDEVPAESDPAVELFEPESGTEMVATVEVPAPAGQPTAETPEDPAPVMPEPMELPPVAIEPIVPDEPVVPDVPDVATAEEPAFEVESAEPVATVVPAEPVVSEVEPEVPTAEVAAAEVTVPEVKLPELDEEVANVPVEVRPSIADEAPARTRGSVLFRPDTDNVWAHRTVPKSKLRGDAFTLTPKVGTVRVLFDGEETMEGRLHGVGAGRVVIDSRLGRLTLGADRVDEITRISTRRGARRTLSSTPSLAGLERVRVRVAGGTFDGHLVAREGNRVTLMLDEGKRITVTATEVVPAGRQRSTSRIRRSSAQGAAPRR